MSKKGEIGQLSEEGCSAIVVHINCQRIFQAFRASGRKEEKQIEQ